MQPSLAGRSWSLVESAAMLVGMMNEVGIAARAVSWSGGGQPYVIGCIRNENAEKTLVVYAHYDFEPGEPIDEWQYLPFSARVVGGKLTGRGVTNARGNLICTLMAVKALKEVYGEVPVSIRFIFDGEGKIGSPSIDGFVSEHKDELQGDAILSLDDSWFEASSRPRVQLGLDGFLRIEIRTAGSRIGDLNSACARLVDNPAWKLVWLLGTMKGKDERILIDGFYDAVRAPSPTERKLLAKNGWDDEEQHKALGVNGFLTGVTGVAALERRFFEPTCTINGFFSGYAGPGRQAIVPSDAYARMDFMLVPEQDPDDILEKVKRHIEKQGIDGATMVPLGIMAPSCTPPECDIARAVIDAARAVYGGNPLLVPRGDASSRMGPWLGGNLRVPCVSSSTGFPDSHGYTPGEFMTKRHFIDGIKYVAAIYSSFGEK